MSCVVPRRKVMPRQARRSAVALAMTVCALTAPVAAFGASAHDDQSGALAPERFDASARLGPPSVSGHDIARHFVGVSVEWTLTDRYMGSNSRPDFANLLRNLGSGVLRIGGSSQDQVPFDASAADSDRFVTPHDLARIRETLNLVNSTGSESGEAREPDWVTVLGTAMAPTTPAFPWRTVDHAVGFVRDGVAPIFRDDAGRRDVAGIALGNEPDLTYSGDLVRYLSEFPAYAGAAFINQWPRVVPASSENIGTWQSIRDRTINTRWFWDWPAILDTVAPAVKDKPGVLGPFATDHFYPLARTCPTDPYRCPTIERLLSRERMDNFDYQVYAHATEAARRGLGYRMDETNTAAGRGAPGVSDVAASATWTLDTLFNAACPQPPDQPRANADCHVGATGVNVHNAEVRAYFFPEEGNAYYNAIRYDPTPAAGPPTPGPSYYALLLFARLAQGTTGLHPVTLDVTTPAGASVTAWEVRTAGADRRLFLINKGSTAATVNVPSPGALVEIDRMTPHDPTGAGRTLDAGDVQIDGRPVAADGTFPGLEPTLTKTDGAALPVAIGPGEAGVVTLHDQYAETVREATVGGSVPATLSLSLEAPASFASFTPGVHRSYQTSTTAAVTSTAGDATLSVADPSQAAPGRLVNGPFALRQPLQVRANSGPLAPLSTEASSPLALLTYTAPATSDAVAIAFRQDIESNEALRTGIYAKTLTFTLSTTTP
ncbi:hypothetical protein [Solirubrobacter ginsenosidimutans]|nr:hypothetical protein [Solirubrobacter ginsenosidimutans]